MNWQRIRAIVGRNLILNYRGFDPLTDIFYWPLFDIIVWDTQWIHAGNGWRADDSFMAFWAHFLACVCKRESRYMSEFFK